MDGPTEAVDAPTVSSVHQGQQASLVVQSYVKNLFLVHHGALTPQPGVPDLRLTIRSARLVSNLPWRPYHVYNIEVSCEHGWWTVQRRYSQFLAFHTASVGWVRYAGLEALPGKVLFIYPSSRLAQQRMASLARYLQGVAHSPVAYDPRFWQFLGVRSWMLNFIPDSPQSFPAPDPSALAREFLYHSRRTAATRLIEYAASLLRTVSTQDAPIPGGARQPPPLRELLVLLVHTGRMSFTSFSLALYYLRKIRRLRGKHSIVGPPHLLFIVGLIVTAKFWFDEPPHPIINNWFTPAEMNSRELDFLCAIGFDLNVGPQEYRHFIRKMETTLAREFDTVPPPPPLPLPQPPDHSRLASWIFTTSDSPSNQ